MFNSLSLKVIIFGFIFTFFSSFGQSFFLGLFNSSIRETLSITHGQFGSIYASATLLSSFLLIWVGKKIDDINIFKFAFYVTLLLSFSCFFFSKISSVTFLFIAVFLMRFSGQGLMSHTATTTIARYFTKSRGKALSAGWFGLSTAEFILPILVIYFLTIFSWRYVWQGIAIIIILILPLLINFTIKRINFDSREDSSITASKFNLLIKIKDVIGKKIKTKIEIEIHIFCHEVMVNKYTIKTGNINSAVERPNQQVLKAFPLDLLKYLAIVVVAV